MGHVLAGGALPPALVLTRFVVPVAALVAVLGRTRWTPVRLMAVLTIAQGRRGARHAAAAYGPS
jgi:hypothetical protein